MLEVNTEKIRYKKKEKTTKSIFQFEISQQSTHILVYEMIAGRNNRLF